MTVDAAAVEAVVADVFELVPVVVNAVEAVVETVVVDVVEVIPSTMTLTLTMTSTENLGVATI